MQVGRQFRQTGVGAAVVVFDAGRLPELAAFAMILKLLPYGKASFGNTLGKCENCVDDVQRTH
jgi:hypothetical protein